MSKTPTDWNVLFGFCEECREKKVLLRDESSGQYGEEEPRIQDWGCEKCDEIWRVKFRWSLAGGVEGDIKAKKHPLSFREYVQIFGRKTRYLTT